jgi:competence protein ComEA
VSRGAAGQAALWVACALALVSLWPPAPRAPLCALPTAGPEPGAVRCDGDTGQGLEGPARLLFGLRLDPNRAVPGSLETLPGIGPARAAAIVAERCRRRFSALVELERVHGIGPRTRASLEPWLEVEPGAPARCGSVH